MIFFYVKKSDHKREVYAPILIPVFDDPTVKSSVTKITANEIKLISWNEISCSVSEKDQREVTNVTELQNLVIDVAKNDPVCKDMNLKAFELYGLYAFPPAGKEISQDNSVDIKLLIERMFLEWAHPMIGNIMNSPTVRPQVMKDQYEKNWDQLKSEYIDKFTEEKIRKLNGLNAKGQTVNPPPKTKLADLTRSSHDQVRICPDVTTLARAIMGEITTLATRRIEKLFALDLCLSTKLWDTQKLLIKELISSFPTQQNALQTAFNAKGLQQTEYIKFYFEGCNGKTLDEQWAFYVALIEAAVGQENIPGLNREKTHSDIIGKDPIKEWLRQWKKFPGPIRCAVVLNSFRRFLIAADTLRLDEKKYSVIYKICETTGQYSYEDAATKDFFPKFTTKQGKLGLFWSWNRHETHSSTETYRKHLLPLWGGPSGHSHGHLGFIFSCLKKTTTTITGATIAISAISLSSLFPFWRLYYDKRISAIHTIAETYEASIAAAMVAKVKSQLKFEAKKVPAAAANPTALVIQGEDAKDAFNIILACQGQDHNVINPIRLMNTLHAFYYGKLIGTNLQAKFDALKKALDDKRAKLTEAGYYIPLWSKPIVDGPQIESDLLTEVDADAVFKLIKIFSLRNVKIYSPPKSDGLQLKLPPASTYSNGGLDELHQRLKSQGTVIKLNENSLANADISAAWKKTILSDEIIITEAEISALQDKGFSITGNSSVLNFGSLPIHATFSLAVSGALNICLKTDATIKEFKFSDHYSDLPKTIDGLNVLSALTLINLSSIKITHEGLFFAAEMNTDAVFWDSAKCVGQLEKLVKADCRITAYLTPAVCSLRTGLSGLFKITDNLAVALNSLTLSSGLRQQDGMMPRFSFLCSLDKLIADISMNVASKRLLINGQFDGGTVFSLGDISRLFGLPDEISFLPDDLSEAVFGNLGLREFSIALNVDPIQVESIDFVVSTEKAWNIFSDKITLEPCLFVSLEYPFNAQKRDLDLHIDGLWQLGSSRFLTSVAPFNGYISAYLQDGETLDLTAAMKTFMSGLTLPQISINHMYFFANYKSDTYEISLAAEKCLEFNLCGVRAGIRDVGFYLLYDNGAMGSFQLSGTLFLGGIALTLEGKYASENDWEFNASGINDLEVKLFELWNNFITDFPSLGNIAAIIPSNFLSFTIGKLMASYSTKTKKIAIIVALDKIIITDSFVIDTVLAEIVIGAEKLEKLAIKAAFKIVGVPLRLEVYKESQGFSLGGGTQTGQSIEISKLLSDFANDVLHYPISLPEALAPFVINKIDFAYTDTDAKTSFCFDCAASFGQGDEVLKNLFSAGAQVRLKAEKNKEGWHYGFKIACEIAINQGQILSCAYNYDQTTPASQNCLALKYQAKTKDDVITLADILKKVGLHDLDDNWAFMTSIGLSNAEISYDFTEKKLSGTLEINSGGTLNVSVTFGDKFAYSIIASSTAVLSLSDLPVVGGLTQKLLPSQNNFNIKDLCFYALSDRDAVRDIPAGVRLNFTALGEKQKWQIYEKNKVESNSEVNKSENNQLTSGAPAPKIFWIKLEKNIAIFTLHRLGLGLDGSYLMAALDASLSVSPLTFRLYGAGIGVNISNFDLKFYLSGFGISFDNGTLIISGELNKSGKTYSGSMLIQIKQISIFAIAQYSEDGSLFAYAVVSAQMGGIPAFFITGLALGFGYHKRLVEPNIDSVANFPLIKGAMGKIGREGMIAELQNHLLDEQGQQFLSFGLKFTTYEIVESFILLTVSFGNNFEIGVLGLSDLTMPPHCPRNVTPIAHAQLALKASFKPAEGFVGVEARLTSESYILSKNCRLTGGFAFYLWFGGIHSGDFVLSLGGYHPKYEINKPAHYPTVPRVGCNWNIGDHVKISGDIYFALTPGALMAGGRLSATFTLGNFKAYFIAKVDFLINWKPFYYDMEIGVILGASYHIKFLFVSKTIKVELGVNMRIWGPDFSAKVRINIWIISFDMEFGAKAPQGAPKLNWDEFCVSFLPQKKALQNDRLSSELDATPHTAAPLNISFGRGLNGQLNLNGAEIKSVDGNGVAITLETVIPISTAKLNDQAVPFTPVTVAVKPMQEGGVNFHADFSVALTAANGCADNFTATLITKNLPSALWGGSGEILYNVPCGLQLNSFEPSIRLFPEKQNISLDDLYLKGATIIENAFCYLRPASFPSYSAQGTIDLFRETVNSPTVSVRRTSYLEALGIKTGQEISLEKYAANAESYFDEEILRPEYDK